MTYMNAKNIIISGNYEYDSMAQMLDTFLLRGRITLEQYKELMESMNSQQRR